MSFATDISKYGTDVYRFVGEALVTTASSIASATSSTAKSAVSACSPITKTTGLVCGTFDRIKSDAGAFAKLLLLGSYSVELLNVGSLKPAARVFGTVAAVFDVLALGGTIDYVAKNIFKKDSFFSDRNTVDDFFVEVSFGVTNIGEAVLWAHDKNFIEIGKYTAKTIGTMTVAALCGYLFMTLNTAQQLSESTDIMSEKSKILSLAWTISEVALIAIPLAGFAPAASFVLAGKVFAKSAAIASFLYR